MRKGPLAIMIAGTRSGCGKTTATLGLLGALKRRGLAVQAFKAGPDFIDTGLHTGILGRDSHNLDLWMMGEESVRLVLERHGRDADVIVVEGAMGLYDGMYGDSETASNAELAKRLGLHVLLVADASSMGRSVGALIKGYAEFDPDVSFAGVVLNRVGSSRHKAVLESALQPSGNGSLSGLPWLAGCLPRNESASIASRHLGLVTSGDGGIHERNMAAMAEMIEDHLDVDGLLARLPPLKRWIGKQDNQRKTTIEQQHKIPVAVAEDRAFCFYYQENLRILEDAGCDLRFFSPLADKEVPRGCRGLYLGGGYPELHVAELAANGTMLESVSSFASRGGIVYAECGGFLYLLETLTDKDGMVHSLCGVLPGASRMMDRFQALGYREVTTTTSTILGEAVTVVRGHEFHYSRLENMEFAQSGVEAVYRLRDKDGWMDRKEGFSRGNVLASYMHLHFGSNPEALHHLAARCAESRVVT